MVYCGGILWTVRGFCGCSIGTSMDTLHGIPWILVDKDYRFHGLIPWNYHQKLEPSRNPYGIRVECPWTKNWNLAGHVTQNAYPKNFRICPWTFHGIRRNPWNPWNSAGKGGGL